MRILGFTKTTLLDYPGRVASTLFLDGCNFRCPFCHNGSLVTPPEGAPSYEIVDVLRLLEKRRGILDGVCISGGEPTIHPELPSLCREIKALGYPVKLDTNGTNPGLLQKLAGEHLIDYVAMDIKSSPARYPALTGMAAPDIKSVSRSVRWLLTDPLPYEFRTTVVRELHKAEDFIEISRWISGARQYCLQSYQDSPQTIRPGFTACPKAQMEEYLELARATIPSARLRGID